MNDATRSTRAFLKSMPPLDAETYLQGFKLPPLHYKIMYLLYVDKVPDIVQATYKLADQHIHISIFKAGRVHREALSWITKNLLKTR